MDAKPGLLSKVHYRLPTTQSTSRAIKESISISFFFKLRISRMFREFNDIFSYFAQSISRIFCEFKFFVLYSQSHFSVNSIIIIIFFLQRISRIFCEFKFFVLYSQSHFFREFKDYFCFSFFFVLRISRIFREFNYIFSYFIQSISRIFREFSDYFLNFFCTPNFTFPWFQRNCFLFLFSQFHEFSVNSMIFFHKCFEIILLITLLITLPTYLTV